jgi:hypothetical protein
MKRRYSPANHCEQGGLEAPTQASSAPERAEGSAISSPEQTTKGRQRRRSQELEKHGIRVRVDLPGVGGNLQDRYEVGVVNRLKRDWTILKDATFTRDDPQSKEWARRRRRVYTTNGAALATIKRSLPERLLPDLFIFALIGRFKAISPATPHDR